MKGQQDKGCKDCVFFAAAVQDSPAWCAKYAINLFQPSRRPPGCEEFKRREGE